MYANMDGSLFYKDSFVTSRDPSKVPAGAHVNMHVAVSAAITHASAACVYGTACIGE